MAQGTGSDLLAGYQRRVLPLPICDPSRLIAGFYKRTLLRSGLALCALPVALWSKEGHTVWDPPFLAFWYTFVLLLCAGRPLLVFTMSTSSRCSSLSLALLVLSIVQLALAVPLPASIPAPLLKSSKSSTSTKPKKGGIVLPFGRQRREVKRQDQNGDVLGGEVGLGDNSDL